MNKKQLLFPKMFPKPVDKCQKMEYNYPIKAKKYAIFEHFSSKIAYLVRSTGIEPAWSYPQDP